MKFSICCLGCKVNNYEANYFSQVLLEKYQEVSFGEFSDIFIIVSCTVTNTAGSKTRQMIHKARSINPNGIIVVVGCYVQVEEINIFDDCQIVVGSNHKLELPKLIEKYLETKERIVLVDDMKNASFEIMKLNSYNQTRAYLKIQDGCNQFCSYCIIPFARGKERCIDADTAINISKELVACGHHEIVLTGIHTGRYHDGNTNLTGLMKRMLNEVSGLQRIRLSSIEMTEVSDELIDLMVDDSRVAAHLHIPLQTGTNRLLKAMNRPYTLDDYFERISYIRKRLPNISISSDVIVGLPTETEDDFNELITFIKKCELSFCHIFPYAAKKGTVAAKMPNQIDGNIKKERVNKLTIVSNELYNKYISGFVGKTLCVYFEREIDGYYIGHCSEYILVKVKSEVNISKQFIDVKIIDVNDDCLIGIR